jgi:hypothetical protein
MNFGFFLRLGFPRPRRHSGLKQTPYKFLLVVVNRFAAPSHMATFKLRLPAANSRQHSTRENRPRALQ